MTSIFFPAEILGFFTIFCSPIHVEAPCIPSHHHQINIRIPLPAILTYHEIPMISLSQSHYITIKSSCPPNLAIYSNNPAQTPHLGCNPSWMPGTIGDLSSNDGDFTMNNWHMMGDCKNVFTKSPMRDDIPSMPDQTIVASTHWWDAPRFFQLSYHKSANFSHWISICLAEIFMCVWLNHHIIL